MILYVDSNYLSPYAMSAYIALREKDLAFELSTLDLGKSEQTLPAFSAISATQRIPLLQDNDFHLSESSAIAEYVNEYYTGPSLYPLDLHARARAREIQAWLRSDLLAIREERSTEVVFLQRSPPPLSAKAQTAANKLFHAAGELLQPGQLHLFEKWCLADTDLALMLNRLVLAGDPIPEHLEHYAQLQWQRPSIQEWLSLPRHIS